MRTTLRRGWGALACVWLAAAPMHAATRGTVEYLRTLPSVKEFTKPRSFLAKMANWIAGPPDGKPEVLRPFSTVRDGTGRLLVADPGQQGVHIFDFEAHKYQFVKGPRGKELISPIDIACDGDDNIYVTDSARAAVYVFDKRGRYLRSIGAVAGDAALKRPTGMYLDRNTRELYLTDTLRHQVLVYRLDGGFVRAIGRRGNGPAEFNYPTALTLSGGTLYVVDSMNFRVEALTPAGKFVGAFGQPGNHSGNFNRPKGIAADADGNLYVVDALFETVQVFDPSGRLLYYFGSSGTAPGQFQLPSGITIDSRNTIYVADSLNRRVQVFQYRRIAE